MTSQNDEPDESSLRPVSSLRSHFENLSPSVQPSSNISSRDGSPASHGRANLRRDVNEPVSAMETALANAQRPNSPHSPRRPSFNTSRSASPLRLVDAGHGYTAANRDISPVNQPNPSAQNGLRQVKEPITPGPGLLTPVTKNKPPVPAKRHGQPLTPAQRESPTALLPQEPSSRSSLDVKPSPSIPARPGRALEQEVQERLSVDMPRGSLDMKNSPFSTPPSSEDESAPALPDRTKRHTSPPRMFEQFKERSLTMLELRDPPSRLVAPVIRRVPPSPRVRDRSVSPEGMRAPARPPRPDAKQDTRSDAFPPPVRRFVAPDVARDTRPPPFDVKIRRAQTDKISSNAPEPVADTSTPKDLPDATHTNRRPPIFEKGPKYILSKADSKVLALCGRYVCTAGRSVVVTNAWTGDMMLSMPMPETIRVTAACFRAAPKGTAEEYHLWIGTNAGELYELDLRTKNQSASDQSSHARREIVSILRRKNDMWTIDEEGKLRVWLPSNSGAPDLDDEQNTYSHRVPRGISHALVVNRHLWVTTGKDIRVFLPGSQDFEVLSRPLGQPSLGEITSSAYMGKVYFGHFDGKVSVYSAEDFTCLETLQVGLYKITQLCGVQDYLWAAFSTGMIYVYDTQESSSWKVKKDWKAHEQSILGLLLDSSSVLNLERRQVASLATDGAVRLWDGMLQTDWLERSLRQQEAKFCSYEEISISVVTWNMGASKSHQFKGNGGDDSFFREVLRGQREPDIIVFGFQELVDLEDKKLTAMSLLSGGGKKKKEAGQVEHLSHQFSDWQQYLKRTMKFNTRDGEDYFLIHSANMVGLFTCVFVKDSLRERISRLSASDVKTGLGGRHGNKGALIVRFLLDDSSVCFINCHLAAGQSQTQHRNNDLISILDAKSFDDFDGFKEQATYFCGGGSGSQIMDHEICILNGDLNYRVDSMTRDLVIKAVKEQNLSKILARDQLLLSMRRNPGHRLKSFQEFPIDFAPTYKYDVGTDRYDSSEKKRSPAWCDRILCRGLGFVKQLDYRRHEVRSSDHRPVSALFLLRVKRIDRRKRDAIWRENEERYQQFLDEQQISPEC